MNLIRKTNMIEQTLIENLLGNADYNDIKEISSMIDKAWEDTKKIGLTPPPASVLQIVEIAYQLGKESKE